MEDFHEDAVNTGGRSNNLEPRPLKPSHSSYKGSESLLIPDTARESSPRKDETEESDNDVLRMQFPIQNVILNAQANHELKAKPMPSIKI